MWGECVPYYGSAHMPTTCALLPRRLHGAIELRCAIIAQHCSGAKCCPDLQQDVTAGDKAETVAVAPSTLLLTAAASQCMMGDALQPLTWQHARMRVTDIQLLVQQGRHRTAHLPLHRASVPLQLRRGNPHLALPSLAGIVHLRLGG